MTPQEQIALLSELDKEIAERVRLKKIVDRLSNSDPPCRSTIKQRREPTIETHTGRFVSPMELRAEDVDIQDIAHALANKCRYTGHCREFYSVAQHSVFVSRVAERLGGHGAAWQGLFHDAGEAYLPDVASPTKRLPEFLGLREAEERALRAVAAHFRFRPRLLPATKRADLIALATEARDLMPSRGLAKEWASLGGVPRDPGPVVPLPPAQAKALFMSRYHELVA